MLRTSVLAATVLATGIAGEDFHGENAEGTVMGPVAFLWPNDRPWSADEDNIAPCGSAALPNQRTPFPLNGGSVALSIADDAWDVDFRIAYSKNPTSQDDFEPILGEISEIEAGHQCYSVPGSSTSTTSAGTDATIQMEYWASDDSSPNGKNQSFYACADISFVTVQAFDINPPCFNVTASDFSWPEPSSTSSKSAPTTTATPSTDSSSSSNEIENGNSDELSAGDKAGIAIGVIVGVGLLASVVFLLMRRRRRGTQNMPTGHVESGKGVDAESVGSKVETAQVEK